MAKGIQVTQVEVVWVVFLNKDVRDWQAPNN